MAQTLNSSFEIETANIYYKDPDMLEYPAFTTNISINGDNIYLFGISNFTTSPLYNTIDSWYHVIKVDSDLNTIWEKWYGGDACYFPRSVCATNDGGCILTGTKYDENYPDQLLDGYILKVDSDGLITWEKEIPLPNSIAQVFPNPGKEKLIIKSTLTETEFLLTDLQGKSILQQKITDENTEINTQNLNPGIYLWTLKKEGKTVESGKWIKE
jgi:hypothetical protein